MTDINLAKHNSHDSKSIPFLGIINLLSKVSNQVFGAISTAKNTNVWNKKLKKNKVI